MAARGGLHDASWRSMIRGGDAPNFQDAWDSYRRSMFYPYLAWAMTIGRAWYQPKMQRVPVCLSILHRPSNAIVDLDSFAALGI